MSVTSLAQMPSAILLRGIAVFRLRYAGLAALLTLGGLLAALFGSSWRLFPDRGNRVFWCATHGRPSR